MRSSEDTIITQQMLHDEIFYNPIDGSMKWKNNHLKYNASKPWSDGRKQTPILGVLKRVHDIIWCYMTGEWPSFCTTYKDGDSTNLAFSNLELSGRPKASSKKFFVGDEKLKPRRDINSIKMGSWEDKHYKCPPPSDASPREIFSYDE